MPPPNANIHLRPSQRIKDALQHRADLEGLPLSRLCMEYLLIRLGYEIGLEHGVLKTGETTIEVDAAIKAAVRELLDEELG